MPYSTVQSMRNSADILISQLKRQGPSNILFDRMYKSNPKFKEFADSVKDKTPEEAFTENGLDFNLFKKYKW